MHIKLAKVEANKSYKRCNIYLFDSFWTRSQTMDFFANTSIVLQWQTITCFSPDYEIRLQPRTSIRDQSHKHCQRRSQEE